MQNLSEIERTVISKFGLTLEKLKNEEYPNLSEVAAFCMRNGYPIAHDKLSAAEFLRQLGEKMSHTEG